MGGFMLGLLCGYLTFTKAGDQLWDKAISNLKNRSGIDACPGGKEKPQNNATEISRQG